MEMSYTEFLQKIKAIETGKLEDFSSRYAYNKGVNAGTWGTSTTITIEEGTELEGTAELHTKGTYPRVNGPHVRVDFKERHEIVNGFMVPNQEKFQASLGKWNGWGNPSIRRSSSGTDGECYLPGGTIIILPGLDKIAYRNIHEPYSEKNKKRLSKLIEEAYGLGKEEIFILYALAAFKDK